MRSHVRTLLIVLLTVGLLGLFLREANLGQVWREIRSARGDLLGLAILLTLFTYVVRALRWQYLLAPIGHTRYATAFRTTVIGFAANFLLPARAGEFLRPYLLARRERLSGTAAFATIIIERLLDFGLVLLLFGAFVALFDPGMAAAEPRVFAAVKVGGLLGAALAFFGLLVMFLLAGHPEAIGRAALGVERWLPARFARLFARLLQTFAEGLAVMRQPWRLLVSLVLSFPLWLSIAGAIWLVSLAFHITLPFTGSFFLVALLMVGVSLPTPGGAGGFHEAFRIGVTVFYGAPNDRAVGAAFVLHAISFLPVTALGIAFMLQDGLSLHRLRDMAQEQAGATGEPRPTVPGSASPPVPPSYPERLRSTGEKEGGAR